MVVVDATKPSLAQTFANTRSDHRDADADMWLLADEGDNATTNATGNSTALSDEDALDYGVFAGVSVALLALCCMALFCWQVVWLRCQRCCQNKRDEQRTGLVNGRSLAPKLKRTNTTEIAEVIAARDGSEEPSKPHHLDEDWAEA